MPRSVSSAELPATLRAWLDAGQWHNHRGHDVFFRRGGDWSDRTRPVLCLIHGFPTASWDWHALWEPLCQRFRVVAPDLIGFGFSDKPRRYPYSILDQADLIEGLLGTVGAVSCHVLAHDYGDSVTQELIAREIDRRTHGLRGMNIQSAVLLNGGLFIEAQRPRPIQKLLAGPLGPALSRFLGRSRFQRSFRKIFAPAHQPTIDELDAFWMLLAHKGGHRLGHKLIRYLNERRVHRARWVGALTAAPMPLRFIVGMADPVSGAMMAARYRELVQEADVIELPGVGHYPQVEAPLAVLEACEKFW